MTVAIAEWWADAALPMLLGFVTTSGITLNIVVWAFMRIEKSLD